MLLIGTLIWSGMNESRVVDFCNELDIGESQDIVIANADKISGASRNQTLLINKKEKLTSNGLMNASCIMEFEKMLLVKKWISIN